MLNTLKNTKKEEEEANSKERDNKEADEEANNPKEKTSPEDADRDDLEIEGKKAMDTFDSFTPQEVDLSSVQEDSGQQSSSTKEMDESGELDTVQKSSSELLKVEDVETHACAKFSRICAKFVLLNAKLEKKQALIYDFCTI